MRKPLVLLAVVAVLSTVAFAADNVYEVFINNQRIDGYRGQDGQIYVSLQKVAQIMGAQLAVQGNRVVVNLGASAVAPQPQARGSIGGTVEYFHLGGEFRKIPDVGASVWLLDRAKVEAAGLTKALKGDATNPIVPSDWRIEERDGTLFLGPRPEQLYRVAISAETTADGNGNYRFENLVPGGYWLLVMSNHARDPNARDGRGQVGLGPATVDAGQTAGHSWLFAVSGR